MFNWLKELLRPKGESNHSTSPSKAQATPPISVTEQPSPMGPQVPAAQPELTLISQRSEVFHPVVAWRRENESKPAAAWSPAAAILYVASNTVVAGDAEIRDRPKLRSIGDGLQVSGNLIIGGVGKTPLKHERARIGIQALPEKLRVDGSLELRSCFKLKRLPQDFSIGRSILIADCDALCELPENLHVNGDLTIVGGRSLSALPSGLKVGGDLRISGTRVTTLPERLVVGGSLIIEGRSRIVSLPEDITIGQDLILRQVKIDRLPEGLKVGRDLILRGLRCLKELPESLIVQRDLEAHDCSKIETVPPSLSIGGSLVLRRCLSLRALPDGLTLTGILDLRGCSSFAAFGSKTGIDGVHPQRTVMVAPHLSNRRGWRRGAIPALSVADCPELKSLPEDLWVNGPIDVAGSGLTGLPESLQTQHILWRGMLVPPDVVFHPDRLDPLAILREENAELRRVMLERADFDKVLAKCGARVLDADHDAGGPRKLVQILQLQHMYLVCQCPSTQRRYLLRVPPSMTRCHQAAAWMAGYDDPAQYKPQIET